MTSPQRALGPRVDLTLHEHAVTSGPSPVAIEALHVGRDLGELGHG